MKSVKNIIYTLVGFVFGFLIVSLLIVPLIRNATPNPPKRVILIAVDTLRYDALDGMLNLSIWSEDAMNYEYCLSTSPWTFPAFASLLTGQYPNDCGADLYRHSPKDKYIHPEAGRIYNHTDTLAVMLHRNGFSTCGITNNAWVSGNTGLDCGFDHFEQYANRPCVDTFIPARKWLDKRGETEPFFLFLQLMDPHLPYEPLKTDVDRFSASHKGRFKYKFANAGGIRDGSLVLTGAEKAQLFMLYTLECLYLDRHLGEFLAYIDETYPDALVIFTSDHGEEFWEHGGFEHGHSMYDEVLHVPLIIKGPGIEAGSSSEAVSLIDIMPTILDYCAIPLTSAIEGGSFLGGISPRRPVFHEAMLYGHEQKAVTFQGCRLIKHYDDEIWYEMLGPGEAMLPEMEKMLTDFITDIHTSPGMDEWTIEELKSLGYLGG